MSAELRLTSSSEAETQALGEALGRAAQPGDVLLLTGPFGAGKTVLVRGLAAGLGVPTEVTSPSFVLVHQHTGRLPLYHVDLYRLAGRIDDELLDELDSYLGGDGVCAIEWPEAVPDSLRAGATEVQLELVDERRRTIVIRSASQRLLAAARAAGLAPAPAQSGGDS